MKELCRTAERTLLSIPEEFRDRITVRTAEYYLQFGPGHGFKTPRGKYWGHKIMTDWLEGRPTPLSEYADGLFDGFKFRFDGAEKLPQDGSGIIVVNQPNTGPLRGNWFKFLVNLAIAENRSRQGNYEARWVQKEVSEHPIFRKTPLGIQRARLARMINKSCNTIIVGSTLSDKENLRAVLEMRRHLVNDGVLVICPEGQDSRVLKRGKSEAGELVALLVDKLQVPIRPVGVWNYKETLKVKFGNQIVVMNESDGQRFADRLMIEIGRLLPEERRGVYRKLAQRPLLSVTT